MSGFSFPPPPPPPPKADANSTQSVQYGSQSRGGRGRGSSRGGDRGNQGGRGRGRGYNSQDQGRHPNSDAGSYHGPGTGSRSINAPGYYQRSQHASYQQSPLPTLPAGAYINPSFAGHQHAWTQPNALSNKSYDSGRNSSNLPSGSPPRTVAGHKRKLEALRGPVQPERTQPGPQTAPAVPSFGASVLPRKPETAQTNAMQTKPKPASNALGLTPGMGVAAYSSSEDEQDDNDIDEEAMHAELGAKLTFEHNGTVMSLNSAADLVAWQNERRKNWPTRARMAEKEAQKRRIGEERKRLLAKASALESANSTQGRDKRASGTRRSVSQTTQDEASTRNGQPTIAAVEAKPETGLEKAKRQLEEQTAKLEVLRKRVADSEALLERTKASQAEEVYAEPANVSAVIKSGVEEDDAQEDNASDEASDILSESSVVSSDSASEADSDDDGPPEETSTKPPAQSTIVSNRPLCRYFTASGYCRDGDACRFRHELPARGSAVHQTTQARPSEQRKRDDAPKLENVLAGDKKSIYQRLLEQQQVEEDRLALQVIKHLGKAGFFDDHLGEGEQ